MAIQISPRFLLTSLLTCLLAATGCARQPPMQPIPTTSGRTPQPSTQTATLPVPATHAPTMTAFSTQAVSRLTSQPTKTQLGGIDAVTMTASFTPQLDSEPERTTFSVDNMQRSQPKDVLHQVSYFGGAGPGECDMFMTFRSIPPNGWGVDTCPDDTVIPYANLVFSAGIFQPDSPVAIEIMTPDGWSLYTDLFAGSDGMVIYEFIPTWTYSYGKHQFRFSGSQGSLEKTIEVVRPPHPELVWFPNEQQLFLYNFQPYENVRLLYYGEKMEPDILNGWQTYHVDSSGELFIDSAGLEHPRFVVAGEKSGQAAFAEVGATNLTQLWAAGDVYCPGALPPLQLDPGMFVEVSGEDLWAYGGYGPVERWAPIPLGTQVEIIWAWTSPACKDGAFWYIVSCPDLPDLDCALYPQMWLPESRGSDYLLLPVGPG